MLLKSLTTQASTAIVMFLYYHFVTSSLNANSEIIYFTVVSIIALSILVTDFSFAITHIQLSDTIQTTVNKVAGLRNVLILSTVLITIIFWNIAANKLDLSFWLIFFIMLLQISELLIPFFLLLVIDKGIVGQILKLVKFIILSIILFLTDNTLTELILINIGLNTVIFILLAIYLSFHFNVRYVNFMLAMRLFSLSETKIYIKNFAPNLGGLLIGSVIPVFGVNFLDPKDLHRLILIDRFARNFENLFQAVLQWNIRKLNNITTKDTLIFCACVVFSGIILIILSPHLIILLLNTNFNTADNFYLKIYCTIVFLGPVSTLIGTGYFTFKGRSLEFALIIVLQGLATIIAIATANHLIQPTYVIPFFYLVAVSTLILRSHKRTHK